MRAHTQSITRTSARAGARARPLPNRRKRPPTAARPSLPARLSVCASVRFPPVALSLQKGSRDAGLRPSGEAVSVRLGTLTCSALIVRPLFLGANSAFGRKIIRITLLFKCCSCGSKFGGWIEFMEWRSHNSTTHGIIYTIDFLLKHLQSQT